jgi:hypothetical protein
MSPRRLLEESTMQRITWMVILLLAPAVASAAPAADAPSTSGLWKIDGEVMGRPVNMMCTLTETNRKLIGTCSGAVDGYAAHKVAGTVKAQKVEFYFQTSIGGNAITLIVNGTLNPNRSRMDGSLDVEPLAVGGTFAASREPAPATDAVTGAAPTTTTDGMSGEGTAATASAATGTWKIDGDVQGTPVKLTCVLTAAEQKLTGTCAVASEDNVPRALTGTVTEKGLGWHFDSEYQGQPITVSMNAMLSIDGSRMNGTMAVAPFDADGTFIGVRQ